MNRPTLETRGTGIPPPEIEQLMDTIKILQTKEFKERKAYEGYLTGLELE